MMSEIVHKKTTLTEVGRLKIRKPIQYWLATAACRMWLTISMGTVFAIWAQDLQSYAYVMCIVIVLDVIRNIYARENSIFANQTTINHKSIVEYTYKSDKSQLRLASLHAVIALLPIPITIIIILLSFNDFFVEFISSIISIDMIAQLLPYFGYIERHANQLIDMGYEERVSFMLFVYLVNLVLFLIGMLLTMYVTSYPNYIVMAGSVLEKLRQNKISIEELSVIKRTRNLLIIMCSIFFLSALSFIILDVDGYLTGGLKYTIQTHEWPFVIFALTISGLLLTSIFIYGALMSIRMSACDLWQQLIRVERVE